MEVAIATKNENKPSVQSGDMKRNPDMDKTAVWLYGCFSRFRVMFHRSPCTCKAHLSASNQRCL